MTGATRRRVLQGVALTATALAVPFVRGAHAGGRLDVGFWDHWVPGANDALTKLANDWAEREKVDLRLDYITSTGDELRKTIDAQAKAKSGYDIVALSSWTTPDHADALEPVDDVVLPLIEQHGAPGKAVEYLGRQRGHWLAVPTGVGSQAKPPCGRIDMLKQLAGLDVVAMYPAAAAQQPALAAAWTWDAFLAAAEKCAKGGYAFGMPLGNSTDAVDWVGARFAAEGAVLVDEEGNIAVASEATRHVLEWFRRLAPSLPPDASTWDDTSNNRWLIAGKGALIMNPPSAWALAKRDAPNIAQLLWTFASPKGVAGRFDPFVPFYWGIWQFSTNKPAAKSLLTHLSQRAAVEKLITASQGYDLPPFAKLYDFPVWDEQSPPKGTLYSYPPRHGDRIESIAAAPAPPKVAVQIYTAATMPKMVARAIGEGGSVVAAIAWAQKELKGFMQT